MPSRLSEMQADLTRQLILDTALELLAERKIADLTVRDVAERAGISERTIFRYLPTREELLDAIAKEVMRRLKAPPPPRSMEELHAFPAALFRSFEAEERLIKTSLQTELFDRIRDSQGRRRWIAIEQLIHRHAPRAPARARKAAATNIKFFLNATTWNYYRAYFGFKVEDTIACAEIAIRDALAGLSHHRPAATKASRAGRARRSRSAS